MNTEQYPDVIYETPVEWGSDTLIAGWEVMHKIIDGLKNAGGDDWNGISIDECERFTLEGMHGDAAIYRQPVRGGQEYFVFTPDPDDPGTFTKSDASGFVGKTLTVAQAAYEIGLPFTHEQAAARVESTPELAAHEATILHDWEDDQHWGWVCTAPVAQIVDWAEAVERDGDPA